MADNQVYSPFGTHTANIPNSAACDNKITIYLTILIPTTSIISSVSCESYTASDAQVYLTSENLHCCNSKLKHL